MRHVMFCRTCRARWPGHARCPDCGDALVVQQDTTHDVRIETLPQFHDLARQLELGRNEVTPRRRRGRRQN